MTQDQPTHLDIGGISIAARHRPGRAPGVAWLGGYRSDMKGTKAAALDAWAAASGHAFTRHDYSGHGESGGDFADGIARQRALRQQALGDPMNRSLMTCEHSAGSCPKPVEPTIANLRFLLGVPNPKQIVSVPALAFAEEKDF